MSKRLLPILVLLSTLACNTLTRAISASTATPVIGTPAYIPTECSNLPLATVPAATEQVPATPSFQDNPQVSPDVQKQVFAAIVQKVSEVYVYPDFNGHDWTAITAKYQAKVDSGLSTADFYAAMEAMIAELGDEHSNFESPAAVAAAKLALAGTNTFVGIGAYILPLPKKNLISLISVFPNSPAEKSGLKPHDAILAVDGIPVVQDGKARPQFVRGPQCSAVVLSVQSPGGTPRNVMLVRTKIVTPEIVDARLVSTADGSRIAYLLLPTFFDETIPKQVASALDEFGDLDGLILDNRMNGGGSSDVVNPILSYFVSGTLGNFVSRAGSRPLKISAHPIHNSQTVPLVVLVGEDTVSFGEIFSGVIQDSGRGKIVGQTTLGNVEILHGYDFQDGSHLWIAQETFVPTHSKANWEQTGIIPDVQAYADWDTFTVETDPGVAAAVKLLGH